jgi:hypothetical protein
MLTKLQLERVTLSSLNTVSNLQRLRQLRLLDIKEAGSSSPSDTQPGRTLCLEQLTQLTSVTLQSLSMFPVGARAVFSTLQQLRQLEVLQPCEDTQGEQADLLRSLPPSLTMLQLQLVEAPMLNTATFWLQGVTALRHLQLTTAQKVDCHLSGIVIDRQTLRSMLDLQVLLLQGISGDAFRPILQAMPSLRRLQTVQLHGGSGGDLYRLPGRLPRLEEYRALLPPSSSLQQFSIKLPGSAMRDGCWQHVFTSQHGRALSGLKKLSVDTRDGTSSLHAGDMRRLVECCPGLEQLQLQGVSWPGGSLRELQ